MQLSDLSNYLAGKFSLEKPRYVLDDHVVCQTYDFVSDISSPFDSESEWFRVGLAGNSLENGVKENRKFRYVIFSPAQNRKFSDAIILLHGLNERRWDKYLPWAYQLVLDTQKPVILFPFAYHINRSPQTWCCPRLMNQFAVLRRTTVPSVENSTFVNVAISMRMDSFPELFIVSGLQTYFDLVKLSSAIRAGQCEPFETGCKIDFFAYSIGVLLAEMFLISNPLKLFSDSKAFFFCGGATFDQINGCTRSIMDSKAFVHLRNHVLSPQTTVPENEMKIPERQTHLLASAWKAFLAMSGLKAHAQDRENALSKLINRVKTIGLKNDFVIPAHAIKETLGRVFNNRRFDVDVLDFPYKYSHETPFPVTNQHVNENVNQAFTQVFQKASLFFLSR